MPTKLLKIGTRKSPLALWQAHYVRDRLQSLYPDLELELVKLTTQGDKILDVPLAETGGKGLFLKELEEALLAGRIDLAVHSMKDVTIDLPQGLHIPVICPRAHPADAFVSNRIQHPDQLPPGSRLGTSSLRRQCQLRSRYPELEVLNLRGNVNTRLAKLDADEFDAIVLACAGLDRLELADRIRWRFPPESMLPAVGQGAVGIECRQSDTRLIEQLRPLNHQTTHCCVRAERAMNKELEGGCQVPLAGFAVIDNDQLWLRGLVGRPDGSELLFSEAFGALDDPEALGKQVAAELLDQGADRILQAL